MKRQGQVKYPVVAITGGFGTGKSTVAVFLKKICGARLISADEIAHKLARPGTSVYRKIVSAFGKGMIKKDRSIDRLKLAEAAFSSSMLLNKLNRIMHPEVIRIIKKEIGRKRNKVLLLDVPLLFETGLHRLADKVIVVKATRQQQVKRILRKSALSEKDVLKRIRAQMPLPEKVRRADFLIDNSGTLDSTKKQVENLRRMLWKN